MQIVTVFIEEDASVTFLNNALVAGFNLGPSITRRYSSVEPDDAVLRLVFHTLRTVFGETGVVSDFTRNWKCLWRARILNGPTLRGRWYNRQEAIDAEIAYFDIHGVKHDRH